MNSVSDIYLAHDSVISLHTQLHGQLRQLILSGRWKTGTRIPSESEFTAHLKVSRSTVRLALQKAEVEGLIERTAGRGTFVAYLASKANINPLVAFVTYGFEADHLYMLKGAESEVKEEGFQIVLSNVQSHLEELDILQRLKPEYISGVLLWPNALATRPEQAMATKYRQVAVPIVLMDRQIYGVDCDCVTSENYSGARLLMQHLIELGHEHIVYLTHHEMQVLTVAERYRAYCDILRDAGLPIYEPWRISKPGLEIGSSETFHALMTTNSLELQQIMDYIQNANPRPTAIFALNDYIAVLAYRAVKLLDLRVPDDISVGGFDDIDMAAHLEVPLTTVAQDMFAIGRYAARRLLDRMHGYSGPAICQTLPTELHVRSSTAVPVRV